MGHRVEWIAIKIKKLNTFSQFKVDLNKCLKNEKF